MTQRTSVWRVRWCCRAALVLFFAFATSAQTSSQAVPQPGTLATGDQAMPATKTGASASAGSQPQLQPNSSQWKYFVDEVFSPITLGGTVFNAAFSQLTNSDPRYGGNHVAFEKRLGASAADIVAQDFFGDYLVASAFQEDPQYYRLGERYRFWHRFGYALSRALVIRTTTGGNGFNWDNVLGSAMGAGFSNLYYPAPSRTGGAMLIHFGTSVADNGFVNLAPEFWPDFRRKVFGWYRRH